MVSEKYHDFAALAVSITDIVLDVLVMLEFRAQRMQTHFALSLTCFALAQTSYSLLFVQRWIRREASFRNLRLAQAVGFVLVWPFAQLIPVLICLEAQGFECVSRGLRVPPLPSTCLFFSSFYIFVSLFEFFHFT